MDKTALEKQTPQKMQYTVEMEEKDMMDFVEKVGNIRVYTEKNLDRDITVSFLNGSDCVMSGVYFANNVKGAIEDLFTKSDTYTEEWLLLNCPIEKLEKLNDNLYKIGEDYFKRIDNTRFFKHFTHKPMLSRREITA